MLKKTITYEDLDGNSFTEVFEFHLREDEIAKMELSKHGGLVAYLNQIVAAEDGEAIINAFEEILLKSYGVRSEDNKKFRKSAEISQDFKDSDAYSKMFLELVTNAEASAEFVRGIMPASIIDADKPVAPNLKPAVSLVQDTPLPVEPYRAMTLDEMKAALAKAQEPTQ